MGEKFFSAVICIFLTQALIAEIKLDESKLIQTNSSNNVEESLLKLNKNQLKARKTELTKQLEQLSVTKSETQNPHTNKRLTTQLIEIIKELELIEQILLTSVGLNILLGDSNDGVGLGAGNDSGNSSGTGTGTGG